MYRGLSEASGDSGNEGYDSRSEASSGFDSETDRSSDDEEEEGVISKPPNARELILRDIARYSGRETRDTRTTAGGGESRSRTSRTSGSI